MQELPSSAELPSGRMCQWVADARGGSPAALGHVLEFCRQYLLLVANRELDGELQGKEGASDLVQETFLEAHRDLRSFTARLQAEVLAWLRRILLNNLSNARRRYVESGKRQIARERHARRIRARGRTQTVAGPRHVLSQRPGRRQEESAALDRALARLPADYHEVILLRHQQGLTFAEIGQLMDRSAEASRKLWSRAICQLRDELEGF